MPENPYESPQTEANAVNPLSGRVLTENMLFYLRGTSPWLRFIGIVGFICLGLMLVGVITLIAGVGSLGDSLGMGGSFSSVIFVIYLPVLVIMFFLVFFIYRFGRRIQTYLHTGDSADLEDAFKNNKSYWTLAGVLCIIWLSIIALALVVSIIAAVAAATQF